MARAVRVMVTIAALVMGSMVGDATHDDELNDGGGGEWTPRGAGTSAEMGERWGTGRAGRMEERGGFSGTGGYSNERPSQLHRGGWSCKGRGLKGCVLNGRWEVETGEDRGAEGLSTGVGVEVGGGDGMGKIVAVAKDRESGERVFIKCTPRESGKGTVVGVRAWRGEEAERAVANSAHLMTATHAEEMGDGSRCLVYPLAEDILTDAMARPRDVRWSLSSAAEVLLDVALGLRELHAAGFCHRDVKHRNVLGMRRGRGPWKLADLDASSLEGEEVTEFMGYPWAVWSPRVRIGPWPTAVPSPEHARHLLALWKGTGEVEPLRARREHDMFQLGVLMFEVVCRRPLLAGRPGMEVLLTLASDRPLELPPCEGGGEDEALLKLASQLMSKQAEKRPRMEVVIETLTSIKAEGKRKRAGERGGEQRERVGTKTERRETEASETEPACKKLDCCFNVKV